MAGKATVMGDKQMRVGEADRGKVEGGGMCEGADRGQREEGRR